MIGAFRRWVRHHPRTVDAVVVGGVFLYDLPLVRFVAMDLTTVRDVAVLVGICGSWLLRRSRPVTAFACMAALSFMQLLGGGGTLPASLLLLPGLFVIAGARPWQVTLGAAVTLELLAIVVVSQWQHFAGTVVDAVYSAIIIAAIAVWGRFVKLRRAYVAALRERAADAERERDLRSQLAVAAERAWIAREIHDTVSHTLSAVVVLADGASRQLRDHPDRAEQALDALTARGRDAMGEMGRMLEVLRRPAPEPKTAWQGVGQLEQLVAEARAWGLPVEFHIQGEQSALDRERDLAVYRIVQEALTNVRKHAGCGVRNVMVELDFGAEALVVGVVDDGRGDVATASYGGYGLIGMRERLRSHGGSLRARPRPEGGFEVRARFPWDGSPLNETETPE